MESGVNLKLPPMKTHYVCYSNHLPVGYGDVVPISQVGTFCGCNSHVQAIAISSLLTAATTSSLMDKLREDREKLAKKSGDYIKELENRMNDLESNMAKEENINEVKDDLNHIKSEITDLKDLLGKKNE
jgi:voltage-gated potassium channel